MTDKSEETLLSVLLTVYIALKIYYNKFLNGWFAKMILYPKNIPPFGLGIDFETSGSTWGGDSSIEHQAVSLGVAIFNTRTFEPVATNHFYIKFDETKYKWSMEAQAIHGITREFLAENGQEPEDVACELIEMILPYFGADPKIMVLGHNIEFDVAFLRQLLEPFGLMFRLHHVKIDTACISFCAFGSHKSDHLFDMTAIEERSQHNALQDILMTLEAVAIIRLLVQTALES
jgi:DNA polymerase III epsilon subunit-like protein